MEETQEFENFYNSDYSFNVEVPKGMNDNDYRDYTLRLNDNITPDERVKYYNQNIPYAEGSLIASRKKEEDGGYIKFAKDFSKTFLPSLWNVGVDIGTAKLQAASSVGRSAGVSAATHVEAIKGYLKREHDITDPYGEIKKYLDEFGLVEEINREELTEAYKEADVIGLNKAINAVKMDMPETTGLGGVVGQGMGSIFTPLSTGLALGKMIQLANRFGLLSYVNNKEKVLEGGGSLQEAEVIGGASGILERQAEMWTLSKWVTSMAAPILSRIAKRGLVGFGQESFQETKDITLLGKYDERTRVQKVLGVVTAGIFGALGEIFGLGLRDLQTKKIRAEITKKAEKEGMSPELAKEVGYTATLDEDANFERLQEEFNKEQDKQAEERALQRKSDTYDALTELGYAPEMASAVISAIDEEVAHTKSSLLESLKDGSFISDEEMARLLSDYEEAVNKGGEDAGKLLQLREMLTDAAKEEKISEDEYLPTVKLQSIIALKTWKMYNEINGMTWDDFLKYKNVAEIKVKEFIDDIRKPLEFEGEATQEQIEQAIVERQQEIKDKYGLKNVNEDIEERIAVMEENGASEEEIKQTAQAMQEIGEQGGKLFSRSSDEIAKDEERKRQYVNDVQNVIREADKKQPDAKVKAGFGTVKNWLVQLSDKFGLNVLGFKHIVDANGIRHIKLGHGEGRETNQLQTPVTNQDIENIPDIVNTPNYLVYGNKTERGRDTVGYLKTMPDNSTYYVEEIREKDKQLAAKTMFKIEGRTAAELIESSRRHTSETSPSAAKLVDTLKNATVIPAFGSNIASGNTEVKQIDENGKLFSKVGDGVDETLYSRNQGSYTPITRIIELAKEHTPDTFLHEVSHNFFMNYFDAIERISDKDSSYYKQAKPIYDYLKQKTGKDRLSELTKPEFDDFAEYITQSFVKYLHTGDAPSASLVDVFERAKKWNISIYHEVVAQNPVSEEVRDFFNTLITEDVDINGINELHDRMSDVLRIVRGAKTGKEALVGGKDKQDIDLLLRALNARRPRRGKTLAEELRQDGGIDIDSELAKTLGYDPKVKNPIFKKGGLFDSIDEIEDYLRDKGIYNFPDAETAEQVAKKEDDIIEIIQNADSTYSQSERYQEDLREAMATNQATAQQVLGEIMDKEGLKNLNEVEDLLLKARAQMNVKGKDIVAVNKNAIKYIESSMWQAKKDVARIMKEQNNTRYNYQQKLKDIIRNLPISYKNKDKLMGNIARVTNKDTFDKVATQVMKRAQEYAEMEEKNMYRDMIKTFLSGTYQRGIKNKRFTYEGNKLFDELRGINKLTKEQAEEVLLVDELRDINELTKEKAEEALLDRIQKTTEEVLTPSELIIRRLLQYKALGADMSLDNIKELALDLGGMIDADIKSRQQFDEMKGLITKKNVEDLVNRIETLKPSSKALLVLSIKNGDFYSIMNELGGKEFADKFNMRVPFAEQELYLNEKLNSAIKQGAEIYGVTPNQFIDVVQELSEKKYTITPIDNYGEDKISKMEIMHILLGMRQKDTKDLILHAYEEFDADGVQLTNQIGDLIANLDVKDIQFASMLQREIAKDYDEENKAYIFRNGVDMPHLENYFPRKSRSGEHGEEEIDAYNNLALQVPSFYKMRGKNSIPIFENVWTTFKVHKADASYAIKVFPKYLELYKVMHNSDVQHRIKTKYGKDVLKEINDMIKSMGAKAYTGIYSSMNGLVAKAAGNWIKAKIGINPAIFAKQLISVTNYAENMPIGEYLGNMGYAATHPKEAYNFMQDIAGDFINTRFKLGRQNEVLSRQMATTDDTKKGILKSSTAQSIDDVITLTVRAGDIAPIIYGGYARVKYLMDKEGKTKEQAREIFIDETLRSQQASSAPTTSNFQKQGGVTKLLTAFQNTPFQYARILAEAQTMHRRGDISTTQYYKTLFNYMIVQPFLLALAANGFYNLFHDDDKDKDLISLSDVGLGAATSWLGGVPLISNVAQSAVQVATGEQPYGISIGLIEDINKAFQKARKKEKTNWDYIDVITPFVEIGTGKPLGVIKRYTKKIVD